MARWIIALMFGMSSSLIMMTLLVAGIVQQTGFGQDLVFSSFFVYTGGYVLLDHIQGSIPLFITAVLYYFIFFTFIGFLIGSVVEYLLKIIKH
jgi:hypothetical protein